MARAVSSNGRILLNLSGSQKDSLLKLAEQFGSSSISSFVGAIADGNYAVVHKDTQKLLDATVAYLNACVKETMGNIGDA